MWGRVCSARALGKISAVQVGAGRRSAVVAVDLASLVVTSEPARAASDDARRVALLDIRTGRTRWTKEAWSFVAADTRGVVLAPEQPGRALIGIDVAFGHTTLGPGRPVRGRADGFDTARLRILASGGRAR